MSVVLLKLYWHLSASSSFTANYYSFIGFSVGCCINEEKIGYLLPTWARKRTCRHFNWMLQLSFTLMITGAFSQNVSKLFSELKLVTDNNLHCKLLLAYNRKHYIISNVNTMTYPLCKINLYVQVYIVCSYRFSSFVLIAITTARKVQLSQNLHLHQYVADQHTASSQCHH